MARSKNWPEPPSKMPPIPAWRVRPVPELAASDASLPRGYDNRLQLSARAM